MKRLWLSGLLVLAAVSAIGCRDQTEGQPKAFDANVDPAAVPLAAEPSKDILADQTVISRLTREAMVAAAAPPATPTTSPASAPAPAPAPSPEPEAPAAPAPAPPAPSPEPPRPTAPPPDGMPMPPRPTAPPPEP